MELTMGRYHGELLLVVARGVNAMVRYRIDSGKLEKSRPASQGGGPDALLTGLPIPNGICMVSLLNGTTPSGLQVSTTLTLSASGVVSLFGLLPMERFEPLVSWRFAWKSADSKVPMMVSVEDNVSSPE